MAWLLRGALLGVGHGLSLGAPVLGMPGLGGAYGGATGGMSPSTASAAGEVLPGESLLMQHRSMLAAQQAAAAAWLMSRQGSLSPVAAAQRAAAGPASDAWLASSNLRLQAALDLGGTESPGPIQEHLHSRQLTMRHGRDQRRRHRAGSTSSLHGSFPLRFPSGANKVCPSPIP